MLIEDIVIFDEVSDRLRCNHIIDAVPAAPILRLALDEGSNSPKVAFVTQEVCMLLALGPEADGI